MIARELHVRLKRLASALLQQPDADAAWRASVLLAVQDSVDNGEIAGFALQVWMANQTPPGPTAEMVPARDATILRNRARGGGASR